MTKNGEHAVDRMNFSWSFGSLRSHRVWPEYLFQCPFTSVMCEEGWSGCKVQGARGRIETLAGAYFRHWYQSFSVQFLLYLDYRLQLGFWRHTQNMCWGCVATLYIVLPHHGTPNETPSKTYSHSSTITQVHSAFKKALHSSSCTLTILHSFASPNFPSPISFFLSNLSS